MMLNGSFVESLPNEFNLYQLELKNKIYPGQWILYKSNPLHVFKSNDEYSLIVAPNNIFDSACSKSDHHFSLPSEEVQIRGSIFDWKTKLNTSNKLIFLSEGNSITSLFNLFNFMKDEWGLKKLQLKLEFILLETSDTFPFKPVPSLFILPLFSSNLIASAPLLEDLKLPARLASKKELPGCFCGSMSTLIQNDQIKSSIQSDTTVISFGDFQFNSEIKKLLTDTSSEQFYVSF